jgi:hypothetical protein
MFKGITQSIGKQQLIWTKVNLSFGVEDLPLIIKTLTHLLV